MARQVEVRSYNEYSEEESVFNLELKRIILTPEEIKRITSQNVVRFRFFEYGKPEKDGMPEPKINVTPWVFNGPVCSTKKLIERRLYSPINISISTGLGGVEQTKSLDVEKMFFVTKDKKLIPLEKGDMSKYMFFSRLGIILPNKVGGRKKIRKDLGSVYEN